MIGKRNVALVNVHSSLRSSPLALGDIAAYANADDDLRQALNFRIFNCSRRVDYAREVQEILDLDPVLVGFSAYSWNYHALRQIAGAVKAARPDVHIVFGGPHVSGEKRIHDTFGDYSFIDFIVDGEGEIGFRQLLRILLGRAGDEAALETVPNLAFRREGGVAINPGGARVLDLDEIPSPYLTGLLPPLPGPVLWETNRGCPYRCAYCYWGNGKSKLYRYSMDRLLEEIDFFAREGSPFFWLADANFGILERDQEIAEAFCRINEKHGRPFRYFGVNWAKKGSDRIVDVASTFVEGGIGCSMTIAYQTLTPEAEELSRRRSLPLDEGSRLLARATQKGIPVYTDLIWGLPGESLAEFLVGLDKVVDLGIPSVFVHPLEVIPGTTYYEEKQGFGLETLAVSDHSQELVLSHPKMTEEHQRRGVELILLHHLFHTFRTCHAVNRLLRVRYGITHSMVCVDFHAYLRSRERSVDAARGELARAMCETLDAAAETHGANIDGRINTVAYALWDNWSVMEDLLHEFYDDVLDRRGGSVPEEERARVHELLRFNLLLAPKYGSSVEGPQRFDFDVAAFYEDLMSKWIAGDEQSPVLHAEPRAYAFDGPNIAPPSPRNSDWTRSVAQRMWAWEAVH